MPAPGRLAPLVHWPLKGKAAFTLLAPLLLSCDAPLLPDPSSVARLQSVSASSRDLGDAALFVGNLVPGVPSGNGILRYDGRGAFIDVFTPGGCCMTFGPGEHLYVTRQGGVHRFDGVTGGFLGVFVPPDPNSAIIAFIPVFGPDGHLYVSYRGAAQSIRRYDASGTLDGDFLVDGTAQGMTGAQFFAFGPDGNVYFASGGTHEVLRFSGRDGAFIDRFVEGGEGGLAAPSGLTFGPGGILYVGSPSTDRVLRFDRDGAYIGDFFPAGSGGLDLPVGITFGPDGNFYVAGAATPPITPRPVKSQSPQFRMPSDAVHGRSNAKRNTLIVATTIAAAHTGQARPNNASRWALSAAPVTSAKGPDAARRIPPSPTRSCRR